MVREWLTAPWSGPGDHWWAEAGGAVTGRDVVLCGHGGCRTFSPKMKIGARTEAVSWVRAPEEKVELTNLAALGRHELSSHEQTGRNLKRLWLRGSQWGKSAFRLIPTR